MPPVRLQVVVEVETDPCVIFHNVVYSNHDYLTTHVYEQPTGKVP